MKAATIKTIEQSIPVANAMPVKLSSRLVSLAKSAANLSDRSLTAQVEHWSILGMQAEKLLAFDQAQALKHADLEVNRVQLQAAAQALQSLFSNTDRSAALKIIQGDEQPSIQAT
jgi:predicted ATPase